MRSGALLLISGISGFVGALGGMGGGLVLIPALTLCGVGLKEVIGLSIVSVIATSCGTPGSYIQARLA